MPPRPARLTLVVVFLSVALLAGSVPRMLLLRQAGTPPARRMLVVAADAADSARQRR